MTNEEIIWNSLIKLGFTEIATAGILGNIQAESALNPKNLQNSYEAKLGYNDNTYTAAVNNGTYSNFVHDSAGYGLCQWTFWSRKQNLLNYAKKKNKSIGNLEMQIEFLYEELKAYKLVDSLNNAKTVKEASNIILLKFEKPQDQSEVVQNKRASYGEAFYKNNAKEQNTPAPAPVVNNKTTYSNSKLVSYTNLTNNKTAVQNKQNNYIIPHVYVGQVTTKNGTDHFTTNCGASCHYVIGTDGTIGQSVLEKDRAWTTGGDKEVKNQYGLFVGGSPNKSQQARNAKGVDFEAITIEMACDSKAPYAINDKVYNALVNLMADIAIRNNMGELKWKADKNLVGNPAAQNVLVHRWFATKSCPGDFVFNHLGDICEKANQIIRSGKTQPISSNIEEKTSENLGEISTSKPTSNNFITYTIKRGDTLSKIAKMFNTTVNKIAADNNIKDVNKIIAGQQIKIQTLEKMTVKTNGSKLRIRQETNTNCSVLGYIMNGQKVNVIEKTNSSWYKIEYNGIVGYCSATYLK